MVFSFCKLLWSSKQSLLGGPLFFLTFPARGKGTKLLSSCGSYTSSQPRDFSPFFFFSVSDLKYDILAYSYSQSDQEYCLC